MGPRKQRAAVLIVILGVLLVLTLIATVFATLSMVERAVTRNYMDSVRAQITAQSGLDHAFTLLRQNPTSKAILYWGNNTTETGDPDNVTPVEWAKNPSFAVETDFDLVTGTGDFENSTVAPRAVNVYNMKTSAVQPVGVSGYTGGTYLRHGNVFSLRVSDLSGRIFVNDGLSQYGGNASSVSRNLARILDNLAAYLNQKYSYGLPTNLGTQIVNGRPPGGYLTTMELAAVIGTDNLKKIRPFITAHAWIDRNVVNPVPLSYETRNDYPVTYYRGSAALPSTSAPVVGGSFSYGGYSYSSATFRRGRAKDRSGAYKFPWEPLRWYPYENSVYSLDELMPQYIEIVSRAPVNVNTAPKEVLVALLADLSGHFVLERRVESPATLFSDVIANGSRSYSYETGVNTEYDAFGFLYTTAPIRGPWQTMMASDINADTLAQHIVDCRTRTGAYATRPFAGPFRSWAQFHRFLDYLATPAPAGGGVLIDNRMIFSGANVTEQRIYASYALADMLKANFNPNLHLNETNPDSNLFLRVDKTDLIVNSTEFSFLPTGYYEIESLGRILKPLSASMGTGSAFTVDTEIVAEKKISVVVKMFDMYRETSQRHFHDQGLLLDKNAAIMTNSNKGLEVGPEPPVGPLPYGDTWNYTFITKPSLDGFARYASSGSTQTTGWTFEWDGYLQLSTIGGLMTNPPALPGSSGSASTSAASSTEFTLNGLNSYEGMHSHFTLDFRCHYHASGIHDECARSSQSKSSWPEPFQRLEPPNTLQGFIGYKAETAGNFSADNSSPPGPYQPIGTPGSSIYHRLARGFRLPAGSPPPTLQPFAPSNLRIDGGYVDRNNGIAYWTDEMISWNSYGGAISAWVKPAFSPLLTGKARKVFAYSSWHRQIAQNPWTGWLWGPYAGAGGAPSQYFSYSDSTPRLNLFDLYFFPGFLHGHINSRACWGVENPLGGQIDSDTHYHDTPWHHGSGHSQSQPSWKKFWWYMNFEGYYRTNSVTAAIRQNRWVHLTWNWFVRKGKGHTGWDCDPHWQFEWLRYEWPSPAAWTKVYINGALASAAATNGSGGGSVYTRQNNFYSYDAKTLIDAHGGYCNHSALDVAIPTNWGTGYPYRIYPLYLNNDFSGTHTANVIRLGEVSYHHPSYTAFPRNMSGDFTIDEFYVYRSTILDSTYQSSSQREAQLNTISPTIASTHYGLGRYYVPKVGPTGDSPSSITDCVYRSGPIRLEVLSPAMQRSLPPPSGISPPPGSAPETTTTVTVTAASNKIRILAVAWTWYAEDYDNNYDLEDFTQFTPYMYNHANPSAPTPLAQSKPCPRVWLRVYNSSGAIKKTFPEATTAEGSPADGFFNDGYSRIYDAATADYSFELADGDTLRYYVGFVIAGGPTVLRATPVFDDITILFTRGEEFLSYISVEITE